MEEDSEEGQGHSIARLPFGSHPSHLRLQGLGLLLLGLALVPSAFAGPTLDRIRSTGLLRYGCDMEGGGPFAYIDPADPNRVLVDEAKSKRVWAALKADKSIPKSATKGTATGAAGGVVAAG